MEIQNSQLTIKVEKNLKETFVQCCKNQDTTASQEMRHFMRSYIAKNGQGKLL